MLAYREYEEAVFNWLTAKNKKSGFTFSLRQTANKGAERDIFIGTAKSSYFATTFWSIPVSYPGSSGDLIQLVFQYSKGKKELAYFFEFKHTKDPDTPQNSSALNVIKSLRVPIEDKFGLRRAFNPSAKIFNFQAKPIEPAYRNLEFMLRDVDSQLVDIIEMVDKAINQEKAINPEFRANRISDTDFNMNLKKALERIGKESTATAMDNPKKESEDTPPLNQILYGPPGTGKTYHTINRAIAIINPAFNLSQSRDVVKAEYKRLVDSGQIVFTTFHQSLSYEDFVEGIKPLIDEDADGNKQVIYDVQPGILKQIIDRMAASKTDSSSESSYTFDDGWNELIELANEQIEGEKEYKLSILTPNMGMLVTEITSNGNLKLRPSKGGGKEYVVSYARTKKLQQEFPNLSLVKNIDKEFRAVIGGMNSTAYWSVLNFINNKIASKGTKTNKSTSTTVIPHVLIIDEINRGNVSSIFGELITLIEESKREGKEEALEVTLPYSKEKFAIPDNLYIIGTMNTADRSVEAIDTALRRRFVFEEMLPDYQLNEIQQEVFGYPASAILKKINDRLEKLIDRDHCIGHAYFIGTDETSIVEAFYKNIIPLLQEYFFGDYGKIGLVLGKGFIAKKLTDSNLFADFDYDYKSELEERAVYEIIDYRHNSIDSGSIQEAIDQLMRHG